MGFPDLPKFHRPDHRFDERVVEVFKAFHERGFIVDRIERGPPLFPDLHHAPFRELVHGLCNGLAGKPDLFHQLGHLELDPVHGQQELKEPGLAGVTE